MLNSVITMDMWRTGREENSSQAPWQLFKPVMESLELYILEMKLLSFTPFMEVICR